MASLSPSNLKTVLKNGKLAKLEDVVKVLKENLSKTRLFEILAILYPVMPQNLGNLGFNWREIAKLKEYRYFSFLAL